MPQVPSVGVATATISVNGRVAVFEPLSVIWMVKL